MFHYLKYDYNFDARNKIISEVNGNYSRKITYVCAEHFSNDDFITNYDVSKYLNAFLQIKKK